MGSQGMVCAERECLNQELLLPRPLFWASEMLDRLSVSLFVWLSFTRMSLKWLDTLPLDSPEHL